MGIGSSCGSVYGEKGDARQAPHFVVRSLPVALFIYPRSDWGSEATKKFRWRMDALKRCDRAPPAARARGRSRGNAVTCVLPG